MEGAIVLPLENLQSLRERIAARLRQAIIAGDLPPGSRLMEPELARRLGVSRTPLREAIRQLEAEGLVTAVPRMGSFVSEVSPQDVEETYAIRAVLEGLAARQAAGNPDPGKAGKLRPILAELARKTSDYRVYHEAAGRFHEAIFALSRNQRLQSMYHSLTHQVARFRTLSLAVPRRPEVSLRQHRRIAEAILRSREGEAERLMREHIEGARAVLRRRVQPERRNRDPRPALAGTAQKGDRHVSRKPRKRP
jgi:DNA-binding GntR family transcriptional regulator